MKLNKAIVLIVSLLMLACFLWSLDNVATFNGSNQYIQINGTRTYDTAFSGLGAVTLEVWIKPTSLQTGGTSIPRNTVINIPRSSSTIGAHIFLVDNGRIRLDGRSTNEDYRGVISTKRVKNRSMDTHSRSIGLSKRQSSPLCKRSSVGRIKSCRICQQDIRKWRKWYQRSDWSWSRLASKLLVPRCHGRA